MAYDGEGNPPGYYNTIERPNPGGAMAEPMGPRGRLVAKMIGAGFVVAAVASLTWQIVDLVANPYGGGAATSFVMGRYVALVLLPVFFGVLGVALLRHADDTPNPYLRPQRRSRRRRSTSHEPSSTSHEVSSASQDASGSAPEAISAAPPETSDPVHEVSSAAPQNNSVPAGGDS